jgi:hypothetical protein
VRVGADQDMVGEADRMSGRAAQHGLFHDDAVPADGDGTTSSMGVPPGFD